MHSNTVQKYTETCFTTDTAVAIHTAQHTESQWKHWEKAGEKGGSNHTPLWTHASVSRCCKKETILGNRMRFLVCVVVWPPCLLTTADSLAMERWVKRTSIGSNTNCNGDGNCLFFGIFCARQQIGNGSQFTGAEDEGGPPRGRQQQQPVAAGWIILVGTEEMRH